MYPINQSAVLERVFRRLDRKMARLEPKIAKALRRQFGTPRKRRRKYSPAEQLVQFRRLTLADFALLAQQIGPEETFRYLYRMHALFIGRRGNQ